MCRRSTCRGTSRTLVRSSTSVRVAGRVARRGRCGQRAAVLERIAPLHTGVPIATFRRDTPARRDAFADERRVVAGDGGGPMKADAKRSSSSIGEQSSSATLPTSAVEWPPTARGYRRSIRVAMLERGRETLIHSIGQCGSAEELRASVAEWPPTAQVSRRAVRFARLELERIAPPHPGALIATFRCAAPARCGAFVGKRRFVAGETDKGSSSPAATRRSQRRPSSPRVGPP
jgi:hypothetical protein